MTEDLAPALAAPDSLVALARIERTLDVRPAGEDDVGRVELALDEPPIASRADGRSPGGRAVVPFTRSRAPVRGGGQGWDAVAMSAGTRLVVALRPAGEGWEVEALLRMGPADPTPDDARAAARLARGAITRSPELVEALAGPRRLLREALVCRLDRDADPAVAVALLGDAIAAAPAARAERLRAVLARRFDPARWASRDNAEVLTALARALLRAPRAERLPWALELARALRHPYDPAPERQERVARALVLLIDAPPVEMVAALEGLGGQGAPDDQAAVRDVLSLWLQL